MNRLLIQEIQQMIPMRFYNSPDGAAGGGGTEDPPNHSDDDGGEDLGGEDLGGGDDGGDSGSKDDDPIVSEAAAEIGVSEEEMKEILRSDPEFAKNLKKSKGEPEDKNKGGEDDHGSEDDSGDGSSADSDKDKQKPEGADDNSSTDDGESDSDFADNVIDGLKGSEFKKLSEDAQEAVAKFYEKAQSDSQKATETETRMQKLLEDPIIKFRAEAIEAGRAAEVEVRGLSAEEKKGIVDKAVSELGLDSDDGEKLLEIIGNGLEQVAKDMATDLSQKAILAQDAQRRVEETTKKGVEMILGLSKYNKALAVKETDIKKFYKPDGKGGFVYNEDHPEIETWKNGLGKIQTWAAQKGIGYDKALDLGDKVFYAMAAAALDMPIALNTGERDKKIVSEARKKALAPFLKGSGPRTLATEGSTGVVDRKKAAQTVTHGGFDVIRLVQDQAYYNKTIERRPNDEEWLEKVYAAAEKGRNILNKRKSQR